MTKAMRLTSATPPTIPPTTATVESLLPLPFPAATTTVLPVVSAPLPAVTVVDPGLVVVNGVAAAVAAGVECRTSLCGGEGATCGTEGVAAVVPAVVLDNTVVAAAAGGSAGVVAARGVVKAVDKAVVLESVSLAWDCGTAAAEKGGTGGKGDDGEEDGNGEAMVEAVLVDSAAAVAAAGAGVVHAGSEVLWTAGTGATCGAPRAAEEVATIEEVGKVLAVLVWILDMSVLGNAVHLLPPSMVRKAPMGKFGLVAMTKVAVSLPS